jgi:hypothetical protein
MGHSTFTPFLPVPAFRGEKRLNAADSREQAVGKALGIAAIIVSLPARQAAAQAPRPSITVIAYNHAGVAADVFARATRRLEWLMADAGVDVSWADPAAPIAPRGYAIRLIVRREPHDPHMPLMGTAVPGGPCSGTAFTFYAVVLDRSHVSKLDAAQVLAYAMAHEIGHLLLPVPGHSDAGIMRPQWTGDDLRRMGNAALRFGADQSRAIAAAAAACNAAG